MAKKLDMEWTDKKPTEPGLYCCQEIGQWKTSCVKVEMGQNYDKIKKEYFKELFYYGEKSSPWIRESNNIWYGPIPDPNKFKH